MFTAAIWFRKSWFFCLLIFIFNLYYLQTENDKWTPSVNRWVWKQQYLPEWTAVEGEEISGTHKGLEISESQHLSFLCHVLTQSIIYLIQPDRVIVPAPCVRNAWNLSCFFHSNGPILSRHGYNSSWMSMTAWWSLDSEAVKYLITFDRGLLHHKAFFTPSLLF